MLVPVDFDDKPFVIINATIAHRELPINVPNMIGSDSGQILADGLSFPRHRISATIEVPSQSRIAERN
jgi:hypothetical protein